MNNLQFKDYETDKRKFEQFYTRHFTPLREKELVILEIGVWKGGSMKLWRDFFPNSKIYGIDCHKGFAGENVFIGDQKDPNFLKGVIEKIGVPDIIIDDGSHKMSDQQGSFDILFPLLNSGGLYVIEDLETSYLSDWQDSKPTTVELLKMLVDRINVYGKSHSAELGERSEFEYLDFGINICLIKKN